MNTDATLPRLAALIFLAAAIAMPAAAADASTRAHDNLTLTVPAGSTGDIAWPGGTIEALPARPQTLAVNLKTRRLHTLTRALGDGDIALATLVTSETGITRLTPLPPPASPVTRIPRALEKLSRGEPLRVTALGTSLVEAGGVPNGWLRLLFDSRGEDPAFAVPGREKVKLASYALGGSNARYTAALMAESSPVYDCDLAIVALLPNEGTDRLAVFEGVVRLLRAREIEVLLLTDNAFAKKGEGDPLWRDGPFVKKLADRYGCALADTAAHMREGELRGETVYGDQIHQSPAGQLRWAEAIAGVLAPGVAPVPADGLAETVTAARSGPTLDNASLVPEGIAVDFLPANTGGKLDTTAPDNRPAKIYGATHAGVLQLDTGATFEMRHPRVKSVDWIIDGSSGFTAEITDVSLDGAAPKNVVYTPRPGTGKRARVQTIFPAAEIAPAAGRSWKVTVTGGTLRLYLVSYHTTAPQK